MNEMIQAESITMNLSDGTIKPSEPIEQCENEQHQFGYTPEIIDDVLQVNVNEDMPDHATCRSCGISLLDFKAKFPDAFNERWSLLEEWQDSFERPIGWSEFVQKVNLLDSEQTSEEYIADMEERKSLLGEPVEGVLEEDGDTK